MGTTGDRTGYGSWWCRWALALAAGVVLTAGVNLLVTPLVASAATTRSVTVAERHVGSLGTILVDRSGQTLYIYTTDRPEHVACTGRCAAVWPPFLLSKGVTKVVGPHSAVLGTIHRPGGRLQVTSHRLPLYRYVGDHRAGQINGEGVEGTWFVATPNGHHPGGAPASSSSPSSTAPAPATAGTSTAPSTAAGQPGSTPTPAQRPVTTTPAAGTTPPPATTPATAPPSTHATTPPPTSPPATSPPATTPPPTTPPTTAPPPTTTTPPSGGVAY